MRFGFGLPHCGPWAGPDALTRVAERAEALGYASLWTVDRLLSPTAPRAAYPASADGKLPRQASRVLDPACYTPQVRSATDLLEWAERLWQTFH